MADIKARESSFELLRIIAQYMIVFYHILLFIVYADTGSPIYKAMWLPLHIGVPLFVIISGYFGIKANVKRLIKLLGLVFVFQVPYLIISNIIGGERIVGPDGGGTLLDWVKILFFISGTPNWFMRTYLFLFLLSPIINSFIKDCSLQRRVYLILSLFFISHYVGILGFDSSLSDGKNAITFIFFYVIGDTIHKYEEKWMKIPGKFYLFSFILINILLISFFVLFQGRIWDVLFDRIFFKYNSIGLLINTILFLMAIGHYKFQSPVINRIAKASIAMYLLQPYYFLFIIPPIVTWLYGITNMSTIPLTILLLVFTAILIILSWIIYEMLTPAWTLLERFSSWCQVSANKMCQKYLN